MLRRLASPAVCLLASCAVLPDYQRPAAPIPAAYERGGHTGATRPSGWTDYFADPDLHAVVERALANSRELRAAVARVEEARALYGIQRADRYPGLAIQGEAARSRTPADLSVFGRSMVAESYQVALALTTWEIDFWGRVRNLETAALESYLATDSARHAFVVSLVAEVANAWLIQRELDRRVALARASIASREESARIFRRRYQLGSSSKLELMQAEQLLIQAQTLGAQLEQAREANRHALDLLVGAPVDPSPRPDAVDEARFMRTIEPGLPSELLVNRPDIRAAEHRLVASQADIGAARAAFFPTITLTGAAGTASTELQGLFRGRNRAWSFFPTISLPIFDAGRLQSNLDLAEARRDIAVAAYERTIQQAFREVSDALAARHWLAQQLALRRQGLATQQERARLAKLRHDSGAAAYLEVLDAQRDLLQAEQDVIAVQRELLTAHVNLFAALGGGPLRVAEPPVQDDRPPADGARGTGSRSQRSGPSMSGS
jgi:multidrug efflux system outer membrane protein